jgi:3-dehydroquinate synthetase
MSDPSIAAPQVRLVIADVDTLRSLPPREYNEGFAEVIKHAAIRDATDEALPLACDSAS